nr:transmembrane protein 255B [Bubalus bubalis]
MVAAFCCAVVDGVFAARHIEPRPLMAGRCQFHSSGAGYLHDVHQTEVTCHSPNGGCPLKVKSNTCYYCDLYEPGVRGRRAGARARGLGRRVSAVPWEGAGRRSGALGCLRASCPAPPPGLEGVVPGFGPVPGGKSQPCGDCPPKPRTPGVLGPCGASRAVCPALLRGLGHSLVKTASGSAACCVSLRRALGPTLPRLPAQAAPLRLQVTRALAMQRPEPPVCHAFVGVGAGRDALQLYWVLRASAALSPGAAAGDRHRGSWGPSRTP